MLWLNQIKQQLNYNTKPNYEKSKGIEKKINLIKFKASLGAFYAIWRGNESGLQVFLQLPDPNGVRAVR